MARLQRGKTPPNANVDMGVTHNKPPRDQLAVKRYYSSAPITAHQDMTLDLNHRHAAGFHKAKPVVTANFLSDPQDVKSLMTGIDLCRQIGNDSAMAPWVKREVVPARNLDDTAKAEFVKNGATTFFHQVGTARMGRDDAAVVGADLKVKGIDGLRIVDGSIMPRIVTCATMATCVFIGERGAELIMAG